MKLWLQRLRRDLVALTVLLVWCASPGCMPRLGEGAAKPVTVQLVAIIEPQIPEHHLLIARRRQDAVERSSRIQRWAADWDAQEATADHRKLIRQEQAFRRKRLEQVADLVPLGYRQLVLDVSSRFEVDPRLVAAVGTVESRWYARAQGRHGDSGLMQILPGTAAWIAPRMGLDDYDLFDPQTNLSMGAWYLRSLRSTYGSWDRALAAYNGGPKAVGLGGDHPYVDRVMQVYRQQGSNMAHVEPSAPR